jgi:plasmid stabilization system protein ParE
LKSSQAADRDLEEIYAYSSRQFGEARADRYLNSLHQTFQQLAERPGRARSADDVRPG